MNIFWAGGICLRSYNEDYPLWLRDKVECGFCSKYHSKMKSLFSSLESPQPISGEIGTPTMLTVTLDAEERAAFWEVEVIALALEAVLEAVDAYGAHKDDLRTGLAAARMFERGDQRIKN